MLQGRRRAELEAAARAIFVEDFDGRVLPFDMEAAAAYADIFTSRRQADRSTPTIDLMIAAVARSNGASVVTRDVGGFEGCGFASQSMGDRMMGTYFTETFGAMRRNTNTDPACGRSLRR